MESQTRVTRLRRRAYDSVSRSFERCCHTTPRRVKWKISNMSSRVKNRISSNGHAHDNNPQFKRRIGIYRINDALMSIESSLSWYTYVLTECVARLLGLSLYQSPHSIRKASRYEAQKCRLLDFISTPRRRWRRRRIQRNQGSQPRESKSLLERSCNLSELSLAPQSQSILYRIPTEVAERIYDFAIGGRIFCLEAQRTESPSDHVMDGPVIRYRTVVSGGDRNVGLDQHFTSLLYVSREIYQLAIKSLYRSNSFNFTAGPPLSAEQPAGGHRFWFKSRILPAMRVQLNQQIPRFQIGLLTQRIKDIRRVQVEIHSPLSPADMMIIARFEKLESFAVYCRDSRCVVNYDVSTYLAWLQIVCDMKSLRHFKINLADIECFSRADRENMLEASVLSPVSDDLATDDIEDRRVSGVWEFTLAIRNFMTDNGWTDNKNISGQRCSRLIFTK